MVLIARLIGLTATFLFISSCIIAQEGFKKFEFGVSAGGYKAHKSTAIRYDGYDGEYFGQYDYSVDYYLNLGTSSQYSVYNQIKQSYNNYNFVRREYPENMRYNIGLSLGVYLGYQLSDWNVFMISADFANLRLNDALTFELTDAPSTTTDPVIRTERITGEEKRLSLNTGFHFNLGTDPDEGVFIELGLNMTSIRVIKNSMIVQNKEYVLTQWTENPAVLYSNADYGGVGFGIFSGLGYRTRIQDQLLVDIGLTGILGRMPLGPKEDRKFRPQGLGYIRIILNK